MKARPAYWIALATLSGFIVLAAAAYQSEAPAPTANTSTTPTTQAATPQQAPVAAPTAPAPAPTAIRSECTSDCSGHDAGYDWAQEHDITDTDYDNGNSESFNEGVRQYAEENQ